MITDKTIFHCAICLLVAALFSSCSEDVITIDLKNAAPRIVIEGKVTEGSGPQSVKISKTTDFFKPGDLLPLTGSQVTIADNGGRREILTEIDPGLYSTSSLAGVPGRTYTLTVKAGDAVYTASSTLNAPSHIDSLAFEVENEDDDSYIVHCFFTDTKDRQEYFRFKLFINGAQYHDYYMYQDRLTDGNHVDYELYFDKKIYNGDKICPKLSYLL